MKNITFHHRERGVSASEYLMMVTLITVVTIIPIYWLAAHTDAVGYYMQDEAAAAERANERATMVQAMGGLESGVVGTVDEPARLEFTPEGVASIASGKGRLRVTFEKSSAALHSALYIVDGSDSVMLLADNHNAAALTTLYDKEWTAGESFLLFIRVDGSVWSKLKKAGYATYDHYSTNALMCEVTQINETTWLLGFEDLPEWWPPDYDYNDTVVTVELVEDGAAEADAA